MTIKSRDIQQVVESFSTSVTIPAHTTLWEQGQYSREAVLILSGEMDIIRDNNTVATLGAGEIIGEAGLLRAPFRRNASVVARTDCTVAVMTPPEFKGLMGTSSHFLNTVTASQNHRNTKTPEK